MVEYKKELANLHDFLHDDTYLFSRYHTINFSYDGIESPEITSTVYTFMRHPERNDKIILAIVSGKDVTETEFSVRTKKDKNKCFNAFISMIKDKYCFNHGLSSAKSHIDEITGYLSGHYFKFKTLFDSLAEEERCMFVKGLFYLSVIEVGEALKCSDEFISDIEQHINFLSQYINISFWDYQLDEEVKNDSKMLIVNLVNGVEMDDFELTLKEEQ